jgi:hypothetical protein
VPKPPKRYLDEDELSVAQIVEQQQARRRGLPKPKFETPDFKQYHARLLAAGGIEPDRPDLDEVPLEDLTAAEHFERLRRYR